MPDVRLIDANELKEKLLGINFAGMGWYKASKAVDDAPTINPEDCRPHGRWITERCNHKPHRLKNPEKWVICKCSVCGYSNGRKQSNYCPNCGAAMDGKEQDDGKERTR